MSVSPCKTENWGEYGSIRGESVSLADIRMLASVKVPTDRMTVISNLLNALLGVGLFCVPWGFQSSGILAGTVILLVVACGSAETVRILLISQQKLFQATGEIMGYSEMAGEAVGPMWSNVVKIATVISCMGGCCVYVIFFGQTLGQAFDLPADNVIYLLTIPLVLLSWIRSFKELTVVTVFGVAATILTVVILMKDGSQYSHTHGSEPIPLVLPETMMRFAGSATFLCKHTMYVCMYMYVCVCVYMWVCGYVCNEYSYLSYPPLCPLYSTLCPLHSTLYTPQSQSTTARCPSERSG
jgi:hypothetical protein